MTDPMTAKGLVSDLHAIVQAFRDGKQPGGREIERVETAAKLIEMMDRDTVDHHLDLIEQTR